MSWHQGRKISDRASRWCAIHVGWGREGIKRKREERRETNSPPCCRTGSVNKGEGPLVDSMYMYVMYSMLL